MKYLKPNFEHEWMEALRYREFEKMGKEEWLNVASNNFTIINYNKVKSVLSNVDLDFDSLDEDKKKRFEMSFNKGAIEIPIAVKFSESDYDLLGGNTRLAGLISKGVNPKIWVVDLTKKEQEVDEMTGAASAGAFVGPISGVKQEPKEQEFTEATDASSSGAYSDVPAFGKTTKGGRKDPLKIDGPSSIYKGRAVTDKNFPKWGGPDSVFIKIKDKCKKFPYCNQGDINAIQIVKEDKELQIAITETSKKYGISYSQVEKIVLNEINKIFI